MSNKPVYTVKVEQMEHPDPDEVIFQATVEEDENLAEYSGTIEGVLCLMGESLQVHWKLNRLTN